jgi:hypothetical protein
MQLLVYLIAILLASNTVRAADRGISLEIGQVGGSVIVHQTDDSSSPKGENVSQEKQEKEQKLSDYSSSTGIRSVIGKVHGNVIFSRGAIIKPGRLIFKGCEASIKDSTVTMGSGIRATKTWSIEDLQRLTKIRASGTGSLHITSGDRNEIAVQADDNILPHISVSLADEELVLQQDEKARLNCKTRIAYTVQLSPARLALLNSIITKLETRIKTPLVVKTLFLSNLGGSFSAKNVTVEGDLSLKNENGFMGLGNVIAKQLTIDHTGNRSLVIESGEVPVGKFTISGGSIQANNLRVKKLELHQSGDSAASCKVLEALTGSLGDGDNYSSFSNYGNGDARDLIVSPESSYQQKSQ